MDEETDTQDVDETNGVDPERDFPGLSVTLAEARRRYDDEEAQRNSVESKTGLVFGVNALIISLVSTIFDAGFLLTILVLLPALVSSYFGLRILAIRDFKRPAKDIGEFYQYAKKDEAVVSDELLNAYMDSTKYNTEKTDEKVEDFKTSYWLTLFSLALIVLIPVIQRVFLWFSGVFRFIVEFYVDILL